MAFIYSIIQTAFCTDIRGNCTMIVTSNGPHVYPRSSAAPRIHHSAINKSRTLSCEPTLSELVQIDVPLLRLIDTREQAPDELQSLCVVSDGGL